VADTAKAGASAPVKDDDDLFDKASSSFLSLKDLKGCLIAFLPVEVDEIPSSVKGGKKDTFNVYKSNVVVLSGTPSDAVGNVKLPYLIEEIGLGGAFNEPMLRDAMRKGRPKVGRVIEEKNKVGTLSMKITEASDADLALARKHIAAVKQLIELASPFDS
jgi:hypothetical protein